MAKPELGTKRVDPETGRKFYDLNKDPIVSPYTGKSYPRSYFEDSKAAVLEEEEEVEEKDEEEQAPSSLPIAGLHRPPFPPMPSASTARGLLGGRGQGLSQRSPP